VIRDLGVQISTTTWGGRRSRFIPTSAVRDLWIHEGFCGFEVRFYLAVVVEGEEGVVVVFPVSVAPGVGGDGSGANQLSGRRCCPTGGFWSWSGGGRKDVCMSPGGWGGRFSERHGYLVPFVGWCSNV